jgi:transcriptional regulator with XRE-family HTH domain
MDDSLKKQLGKLVRSYRLKRNLTQAELALAIGKSSIFVSSIEIGRSSLPVELFGVLSVVLEMQASDTSKAFKLIQKDATNKIRDGFERGVRSARASI